MAFCNFKITAPTNSCLDRKTKKMFAISYVIIFDFHPKLDLDFVIIERSFCPSLEKLTNISYLIRDQLTFENTKTILQLRDCALNAHRHASKKAIS